MSDSLPRPVADRPRIGQAVGLLAVSLAVAPLLVAGCAGKAAPRGGRVSVTVAPAEQRDMPFALPATGTVEPIGSAAVGAQVGGVVTRVAFREGDEVRAGQVLVELDPRPFRAALDQVTATMARDHAQAEKARSDAARARVLFEQGAIAQADWELARSTADAMTATVQADSAAVASARLNLQYASIRAPIAGRTGALQVHVGDLVRAASTDPVVTINQTHPMRVRFTVPESAVPLVQRHRGDHPRILVRTADRDTFDLVGALAFVDNGVDPASGTLLLKGEFSNTQNRLVPGQVVDVRLVLYVQPKATVVPAPAVTTGQQGAYVYVLNRDSTVTPRPVTVERTEDEMAILSGGLRAGETVITDGQLRLTPGARVVVRSSGGAL